MPPTRNDPVVAEDDEDTFRPHLQYRRTKDPGGWVLKSGYLKDNDPITDTWVQNRDEPFPFSSHTMVGL